MINKPVAYCFTVLLFLSACAGGEKNVNIDGIARNLDKTVVLIKKGDSTVAGANIMNGKFELHPYIKPDYYTLQIFYEGNNRPEVYPVYLEDRQYSIQLDTSRYKFPQISTNSSRQKELNKFYEETYPAKQGFNASYQKALYAMNHDFADASPEMANTIADNLRIAEDNLQNSKNILIDSFIIRHPNFYASAYLLSKKETAIINRPDFYKGLFEKLANKVKDSPYGRKAHKLVDYYQKGKIGSTMPDVAGETPDGKSFDKASLRDKVTLIAFYANWNKPSVKELLSLKDLYQKYRKQGLEILAISIDKNKVQWKQFISANNLNWINVSDFKGAYSENFERFSNQRIPFYLIADKNLKIVERDIPFDAIQVNVQQYIK